jgi:hypothetical protein
MRDVTGDGDCLLAGDTNDTRRETRIGFAPAARTAPTGGEQTRNQLCSPVDRMEAVTCVRQDLRKRNPPFCFRSSPSLCRASRCRSVSAAPLALILHPSSRLRVSSHGHPDRPCEC